MTPLVAALLGGGGFGTLFAGIVAAVYQHKSAKSKDAVEDRKAVLTSYSTAMNDVMSFTELLRKEIAEMRARQEGDAERITRLEKARIVALNHIAALEQHISQGKPPPPPVRPADL